MKSPFRFTKTKHFTLQSPTTDRSTGDEHDSVGSSPRPINLTDADDDNVEDHPTTPPQSHKRSSSSPSIIIDASSGLPPAPHSPTGTKSHRGSSRIVRTLSETVGGRSRRATSEHIVDSVQVSRDKVVAPDTLDVIFVKITKTGRAPIWFDPRNDTESLPITVLSRLEVVCVGRNTRRTVLGHGTIESMESPIRIELEDGIHMVEFSCNVSKPILDMGIEDFKLIAFGFVACGIMLEAHLSPTLVLQLFTAFGSYYCFIFLVSFGLSAESKERGILHSCRVSNAKNDPAGKVSTHIVEKEVLSDEETMKLRELRSRVEIEFLLAEKVFRDFYSTSEGQRLLKHFAPSKDSTSYKFDNDSLNAKIHDDDFMIKFLRAERMRVEPASKMAKKALLIRVGLDFDNFPESQPLLMEYITCHAFALAQGMPTLEEKLSYRLENAYTDGRDGVKIMFYRPCKLNQKLYLKHVCGGDLGRLGAAMITTNEWLRRDASHFHKLTGRPSRLSYAFDLEDFSMSYMISPFSILSVVRITFPIMTTCFPDFIHQLILYNVSPGFLVFWERLVKPFLSESVKSKLVVIGKGHNSLKELRKIIDDENLPAYLGGKLVGKIAPYAGDVYCRDRIGAVGPYLPDKGISILTAASPTSGGP